MEKSDDKYLLPQPVEPESRQPAQHKSDQRLAIAAIVVAAIAVVFSGIQACEANQARVDAKSAAEKQAKDVERSRVAAESSAVAANLSAGAAWASLPKLEDLVSAQRDQTSNTQNLFRLDHAPSIGLTETSFKTVFGNSVPKLEYGHPVTATIGIKMVSGSADGCKISSGAFFSSTNKVDPKSHLSAIPGILGFSTGSSIIVPISSEPPNKSVSAQTGTVRFYIHFSVDCRKTLLGKSPFHDYSCMYFPVSSAGEVIDAFHGCKPVESLNP